MLVSAPAHHPFFLLLCLPSLALALDNRQSWSPFSYLWRRASRSVPEQGYYDPRDHGGSWLTIVEGTFPAGQGEPINMVISGNSDEAVLNDQEIDGGLRNYWLSLDFAGECLGQHSGSDQGANLGDGNGAKNETAVIRYDYHDPQLGTCQETINGGNHFRYWVQDGDDANSGAVFMAVSYEMPVALQHDIVPNGYNLARDYIVSNITHSDIPTLELTNGTTYSGSTSFGGWTYQTDVIYLSGLLENTSIGINHNITVQTKDSNASDGLVALLTVKITDRPAGGALSISMTPQLAILPPLLVLMLVLFLPLAWL
ncbi:hypothetical protein VKT23_007893 [Stygiomarasmius scandens]|uniref:Uncharacterized protein n=1 Tax=Marasmiellus scandens TaxID=2682957 RepID=A0ABR1JMZ3_9AGAR